MLDQAFGIFNNVSPRFQWAELDLPFPCDEAYFQLANYEDLVAQSLHPQNKMKIKDAFLLLFAPPETAEEDLKVLRSGNLTALDMQMLIHCKRAFPNLLPLLIIMLTRLNSRPIHPRLEMHLLEPNGWTTHDKYTRSHKTIQDCYAELATCLGSNKGIHA